MAIPELEQRLFRYGRHLIREGRSVRRWIEPGKLKGTIAEDVESQADVEERREMAP